MSVARTGVAVALAVLAAAPAAEAARPSNAPLSPTARVHAFTGNASGFGVIAFPELAAASCRQPFCDGYVLSVPKGLPAGSEVHVRVTALDAAGPTDLYLSDPAGPSSKTRHAGTTASPSTALTMRDPVPGDWLLQMYTSAPAYLSAGRLEGRVELVLPEQPPPG